MLFEDLRIKQPPQQNELEITLFGKGYGECVVIHTGNGEYIVVDSFINNESHNPIAIDYLNALGISLNQVKRIVATHWHKDHVDGLYQLLLSSKNAIFVTSSIINNDKFNAFLEIGADKKMKEWSSTSEFNNILHYLFEGKRDLLLAASQKIIYENTDQDIRYELRSLSPQDMEVLEYIRQLKLPEERTVVYTYPDDNAISTVLWLEAGNETILIGGDLENKKTYGWEAIVKKHNGRKKATLFKIPHHGSNTGHNDKVWSDMLIEKPISILTVFNQSSLPKPEDKERLKNLSSKVFIAGGMSKRKKDPRLNKIKRNFFVELDKINTSVGMVRCRKFTSDRDTNWNIECFGMVEQI